MTDYVRIKKATLYAALHREREVGIMLAAHGYKVCAECSAKMVCRECSNKPVEGDR